MGAPRKGRRGRGRHATSAGRGAAPRRSPQAYQIDQLYSTAPVGLCLLDRELRYVRINERLADIHGRPAAEHIGRSVHEMIPDLAGKVEGILRQVMATGKPVLNVEVQGTTAADPDRIRTWLASYHPVYSRSGEVDGISIAVQEATELRGAEEAVAQRLQFETLLSDLSASFVSLAEDQVDQAILDGLRRVVEFLGVDRGTLLDLSEDKTVLRVTHSCAVPGFAPVPPGPVEDLLPWYAAAIRQGELVRLSGRMGLPAEAAGEREYTRREGIKASLSIPLSVGGTLVGAIALTSFRAEWDWPDALLPRLRLVGELFATAIARRRSEEALAERLRFETLLSELSAAFASVPADEVDGQIERWLRRIVEFLDIERATVAPFDGGEGDFLITHSWARPGWPPVPPLIPRDAVPWIRAKVLAGETVVVPRWNDLPPEAQRDKETALRVGAKAAVFIPLAVAGSVIGAVAFDSLRQERSWPEDLVQRIRLVGEILATALMRKRTQEQLDRALRFHELVSHLSAAFVSVPAAEVDGEIERWLQRIVEFLEIDRSTVAELAEGGRGFRVTHSWAAPGSSPVPPDIPRKEIPWFLGTLLRGQMIKFSALDELPPEASRDRETLRRIGQKSNLTIPLTVAGSVIGLAAFGTLRRERPWPEELVRQLQLVGQVFANALMRKRSQAERDELLRFEDLVARLSATFINVPAHAMDQVIEDALRLTAEFLGVDRATAYEFSEDRTVLRATHLFAAPGVARAPTMVRSDQFPWFVERLLSGQSIAVGRPGDLAGEAALERDYLASAGIKAFAVVPLAAGGSILGAVGWTAVRSPRTWPEPLVQRLRLVGEIFASALARQRADEALRRSEERFRLLLETTRAVAWEADATTWQFTYVGPQAVALLGYPLEDWYKPGFWTAHLHPEDREAAISFCLEQSRTSTDYAFEYRMIAAGGAPVWIHDIVSVERADGQPRMLRGFMLDISERKRAEERFRLAVEASPSAIVMVDGQGQIVLVNGLTEKLFGYSREELIGQSVEILVPQRFRGDHPALRAEFFAAPEARPMGAGRDLFARRKDGTEFLVEIGLNPIHTNEGALVLAAIVDITERLRTESELRRQREELAHVTRVATMGELAAALAHELNQPLGAILSNAEAAELLLAADPPALDEVRAILADITKDDRRAGEVIRRMRGLLRKGELESQPQDLNDLIRDVARLVDPEAHIRRVALLLHLHPDLPPVRGDRVHLQQAVLNLMLNGMEAMGKLPPAERTLIVRTQKVSAQTVEVVFEDQGVGIPADRLTRIFEPFHSTKPGGMGMGLSIVRSIVEAHGGRVWAENNPQRGATVRFFLPACEAAPA